MSPPALVIVLLACVAACAESSGDTIRVSRKTRGPISKEDTPAGCMYEGRWYSAGASVRTREACLACVCAHGALSCRRRTCAPLAEPPPRCHIVHQRGECCPELQCPDGVKAMELGQSARRDDAETETPSSTGHVFPACVEGGTVYAAGSAMSSSTACEQCFCLGGTRRCVRPVCLPPPPGCKARPAPGACCPQRYYCEHAVTKPPNERNPHDCITPEGKWAFEGERVKSAETAADCIQCFCLRGSIRCQHLACAPTLQGCTPLVQQGQCCPHQYQCGLHKNGTKIHNLNKKRMNTLMSLKDEERSLHSSKSTKRETTIKELTTDKSTSAITKAQSTTTKIKRNTDEPLIANPKMDKGSFSTLQAEQTTQTLSDVPEYTTLEESVEMTTEQPEGSVKIIINGTINCTAELSSTSLLLNVSNDDDSVWIKNEGQPRIPLTNKIENDTLSSTDIITEKTFNSDFDDENNSFTINVTSSLRTNTTRATATSTSSTVNPKTVAPALLGAANISKVKKDEQDYDYTEPTLPPSLPNLKIIPFVAADAVVDDEVSSKESLDYPELETDDKFPVYYPNKETSQSAYAMRKEDVYNPTQYPVFVSKKIETQYPSLTQEGNSANVKYSSLSNEKPAEVHEYTVTASLGSSSKINHDIEEKSSFVNNKFEVETPAVNLFSPPVETEGGFVPKDPGIDEFYSVYQSTPPAPVIHHLTTSMQLEPKDECVTSDGRHLSEGESISLACSMCTCAWGELHCSPRVCSTPPGCTRRAATSSTSDLCCGELVCDKYNATTAVPLFSTQKFALTLSETKVPLRDKNDVSTQPQSTTTSSTTVIPKYNNSNPENVLIDLAKKEFVTSLESNNSTQTLVTSGPNVYESSTENLDKEVTQNSSQSIEYDYEDDEGGFSLGNVLQMLLSETFETTTTNSPTTTRKATTVTQSPTYYTNRPVSTLKDKSTPNDEIDEDFVPVTHRFPIIPPKKVYPQSPVNRIDHLILGESNSIRKTTQRPMTVFKPIPYPTTRRPTSSPKTTQRPLTTKLLEITSKEGFAGQSVEIRPPNQIMLPGLNLGLPKLAGCNIYGRMYRVGRIIAELSSPCQECKCTELGVQCRSLSC
ncbi:uncharacterized protein LOC124533577 isoform X1 [Vanessa cardui]|uniref:uncharacterized protein LOC124533577 isoform X1 n=1 Tax=Vanessa cardui TaxID=171605 RepID=UPI001F13C5EE|nr:uncharacterized protein LOC124533577 isoform X1 [Vanessa cardui]